MDKDLGFVLDFNLLNICCVILTVIYLILRASRVCGAI